MRRLFITSFLTTSFLPPTFSQFTPLSLFERRQPQGCHYPSLTDGTYIYFTNQSNSLLHYSIFTPWTRFYPDALRADLVEQGFQLHVQQAKNESDVCGWETVDVVKKHGWHRGDVSFRHISNRAANSHKPADTKVQNPTAIPHNLQTILAAPAKASAKPPASMAVQLVGHTQRSPSPAKADLKAELRPTNETLRRIHNVLVTNSPEADMLFMMLEITLPIIGVIAFLTLMLLIMRRITNKIYPNTEEESEQGDIELSPVRKRSALRSDKTLVNPRKLSKTRYPRAEDRFPDSKDGGVFAWRLAMEKPNQLPQSSIARTEERHPHTNAAGFFGLSLEQPRQPRQSSSIYSRSMDGVTLYPERNTGSWASR